MKYVALSFFVFAGMDLVLGIAGLLIGNYPPALLMLALAGLNMLVGNDFLSKSKELQ